MAVQQQQQNASSGERASEQQQTTAAAAEKQPAGEKESRQPMSGKQSAPPAPTTPKASARAADPYLGTAILKAVLNWAEHSVREQLCLLEMFKLAVRFLIDVFDLGERLCSRPTSWALGCSRRFQHRIWEQASDWLNSFVVVELFCGGRRRTSSITFKMDATDKSDEDTFRLIDGLEKHPCLWDPRDRDYKNRHLKNQAAMEIGHAFNWSGGKAQAMWKNVSSEMKKV